VWNICSAIDLSFGRDQKPTILKENVKTLLHKEIGIENDQAEGQRQDVITSSNFEEISDRFL
jgi:hypothetical protein